MSRLLSRRNFVKAAGVAVAGSGLAACGATPTPQVIKEVVTQVVEKEVTKIVEGTPQVVKETVVVEQVVEQTVVVEKVVEATAAPAEKVKLLFNSVGWGGWLSEPWIAMIGQFNESQNGIVAEYQDIAEGNAKVMAQAAGNVAADAYIWWTLSMPAFSAKNFFVALEEFVASSQVVKEDDYFAGDWSEMLWAGHLYNIPYDNSPAMIWYNPDLFDEAGVAYPPSHFGEWKWADFLDTTTKLTKGEGVGRVYGWAGQRWWIYQLCWIWSNGGTWLGEDDTKAAMNTPENKEALQWAADMVRKYKVQPMADEIIQGGNSAMFMARRAAMTLYGTWWAIDLKAASAESGLRWNMAPMPDGAAGSFVRNPLDSLGIWTGSQRRSEAWQLLEFLSKPEVMAVIVKAGLSMSRRDIMNSDVFLKQEPTDVNWHLFAEALDGHVKAHPHTPAFVQMNDLTTPLWEGVLDGAMSVDEFLAQAETQTNDVLAECVRMGMCPAA